ncbi:hypothetical protein O1Q96_25235 [Streptomyces sp. Qhu-G9]|uniref:peptidoglycan-binding domain-containing protein n=1 Tax=Streptomyces sp. Qhu-G9 TaxID=3452799 RepID=UPI0022AC3E6A|nr:hypothetical protein [Streptomyces aurantiacus]WAU82717.1 hypothetical protein O1Q96_25235 [Streptomyces aurantiacus]
MRKAGKSKALLATGTMMAALLGGVITAAPANAAAPVFASGSAAAAASPCGETTIRSRTDNTLIIVPRIRGGISTCYVQQGMSGDYVYALQINVLVCYSGTPAATYIKNSGGADGVYGTGTREAFKWIQKNVWGLTGSNVDGVYGPYARDHMLFAVWWHTNLNPTTTTGRCSRYKV